jgi:hypothetical protein
MPLDEGSPNRDSIIAISTALRALDYDLDVHGAEASVDEAAFALLDALDQLDAPRPPDLMQPTIEERRAWLDARFTELRKDGIL